jgi:hypothetical protein
MTSPTPPHRGPSFDTSTSGTDDTGEVPLIPFDDDGLAPGPVSAAGPESSSAAGDEPTADDADDDEDFAPRPRQRYGLLSGMLVLALAIALGFLGGEIVQKHYGTAASATGLTARRAAFAGGEGGFGGFGAGTGTGNGAGTGARAGTGNAAGTGTTTTPAVIGTVASIKGNTVVVKNLGGKSVTVHLTTATTITVSVKNKALKVGQTVAVVGTTAAGIVTARSVVVQ